MNRGGTILDSSGNTALKSSTGLHLGEVAEGSHDSLGGEHSRQREEQGLEVGACVGGQPRARGYGGQER